MTDLLIDRFMPLCDVGKVHKVQVNARPATVFARVEAFNFVDSPLVRLLFLLRGLGSRMGWEDMERAGFVRLGQRENEELLLGLVGRFWKVSGDIQHVEAEEFAQFDQSGFAKVTWNFSAEAHAEGTLLTTETRIACTDDVARRRFLRYWHLVGPFSGLIRRRMLSSIKSDVESGQICRM